MPLAEKSLIRRVRKTARSGPGVVAGIGDDCAILKIPAGHEILVTTDLSLEGVHFRRDWQSPGVIGHRCLLRGLSDIAAMGGEPVGAFLSLGTPRDVAQSWVDGFVKGLLKLAGEFKVSLAGGDTAESPQGIVADIVVMGSAPKGSAVRRSGARPGDEIYVTGQMGGAATLLKAMLAGRNLRRHESEAGFRLLPRVEVGKILRRRRLASAMIDLSDGLSTDLAHLCEESGVGANLEAEAIPRARIKRGSEWVDLESALHGGEDYELLFTAAAGKAIPSRIAGVPVTWIGRVTRKKGIVLMDEKGRTAGLRPGGWEHFLRSSQA